MGTLHRWLRAHPALAGSVLAIGLFVVDALSWPVYGSPQVRYLTAGALLCAPLVLRALRPRLSAALVLLAGAVQLVLLQIPMLRPADLALCISLYTVVTAVGRRTGLVYLVLLLAGGVYWAIDQLSTPVDIVVVATAFGCTWVFAEYVIARRAYFAEVEERIRHLEAERDQQAKISVADERARIARELHDVIAHSVGVMVVQADGAAAVLSRRPEQAEAALRAISSSGRAALEELRRVLGVLRSDREPDAAEASRMPQPGIAALHELAGTVQRVGLPVELVTKGSLDDLPVGVGLGIYRIVQEALTNTLKHAGPDAGASVVVAREGNSVRVDVRDNGKAAPPLPPFPIAELDALEPESVGHGLTGMRERASMLGGTFRAGPHPQGGGWHVHVTLPVREREGAP